MPSEKRKGDGIPDTGVRDGCEPPCGFWELNLGPLKEQQVLLTAEPSLQLPCQVFSGVPGVTSYMLGKYSLLGYMYITVELQKLITWVLNFQILSINANCKEAVSQPHH